MTWTRWTTLVKMLDRWAEIHNRQLEVHVLSPKWWSHFPVLKHYVLCVVRDRKT